MPRGGHTTALLVTVAASALLLTGCGDARPAEPSTPAQNSAEPGASDPGASDPGAGQLGTLDEPVELATALQAPWSIAFLDASRSGLVLSAIQGRDYARIYLKELDRGRAPIALSPEEQEAVERAMAG